MTLERIQRKIETLEHQKEDLILEVNMLEGSLYALKQIEAQLLKQATEELQQPAAVPEIVGP